VESYLTPIETPRDYTQRKSRILVRSVRERRA
jgi:hypothetical protein